MTEPAHLVLVVDDDDDIRSLVSEALVDRGYRVVQARNGQDGLEQVAKEDPQLVLLDMWMPVMDGWGFVQAMRDRYGRKYPIVVMTAAENVKLRADEIGANAELGKPFAVERLYEVVEDIIGAP
jgi:CheY-like chemotaxis protein